MKRNQRKSLPWRRVGYLILIIIKFNELLPLISLWIINTDEKLYQTLERVFHQISKYFKVGWKKLSCTLFFQPTSQCLDIWWKLTLFLVFDILLHKVSPWLKSLPDPKSNSNTLCQLYKIDRNLCSCTGTTPKNRNHSEGLHSTWTFPQVDSKFTYVSYLLPNNGQNENKTNVQYSY